MDIAISCRKLLRSGHENLMEPAYINTQSAMKMLLHVANVIPLGPILLILIKYGEMKAQSMSGVTP
ncbi:hypothetical protein NN484_21780 [Pseudomonas serboccidentalis]|uniref:Uncharacterized protein n=1 Tax=Pseudomonas serboccidentalis TaxID=2964670 RepID=A0ABY7Z6K7_9PSED|nr:hypothetical protein [Pseudomonas serboccidentalis]WDR35110.1 hypothetical protein NN484_21780 [Pseudomonas serboccidentalis]